MANEQNLMPIQEVNSRRTREQHSRDSAKGGRRSGEVRRQRKAMKEQMERLLAMPFNITDEYGNKAARSIAESIGIDEEEIDNQMAMIISLWKTAMGNSNLKVQAVREIREMVKDEEAKDSSHRVQIINDLPRDEDEAD